MWVCGSKFNAPIRKTVIQTHPMGGWSEEKVKEAIKIPLKTMLYLFWLWAKKVI